MNLVADSAAAAGQLRRLLAVDDRLLAAGEWDELIELVARRPAGDALEALTTRRSDLAGRGYTAPGWDGWDAIDALRVRELYPTARSREALLDRILATPRDSLTRDQLHAVHGLIELGNDRPHRLRPIPSDVDAAWMAERVGDGRSITDAWVGWAMFDEAIVAGTIPADPAVRSRWLATELAQRRATGTTSDALALLLARRHDLLPVTPDTSVQLAKAATMLDVLGAVRYPTPAEARPAFAEAGAALSQARAAAGELAPLVDEASALVDRNLARIDGLLASDEPGHLTYPDFADAGRIRSTLELLDRTAVDAATESIVW